VPRMIAPRTGAPEVTVAEEQEEYLPITVALYLDEKGARHILTRWTFTAEERAAIAAGEDVYVAQLGAPNTPMTPMNVLVGPGTYAGG
jgi:hypothetical protein